MKKMDPKAPRRSRSLFSLLFVPNFKPGITPIGEASNVFVNLLALLFVTYRLFPANHPALRPNSEVHLGFREVIGTAYNNLSFTKQGIPQVLFFFAVIGCITVVTLTALIALCSLFIGRAHAATTPSLTSMFTAPGGANDGGQLIINYLFQGQQTGAYDSNTGASPVNSGQASYIIQCGLYTALGYYSDAILIVAAMVLFYHLTWMTVETAHHGQVMGQRGNQVWAPIRLVFAIGLLVPVGGTPPANCTTGGTGLNAGQMLVISIASWGSGLASNVWQTFLNQLAQDTTLQYVAPGTGPVRQIVSDVLAMYACQWGYNWYIDGRGSNASAMNSNNPSYGQFVIFEPNTAGGGYPDITASPGTGYFGSPPAFGNIPAPGDPSTPFHTVDPATGNETFTFTNIASRDVPLCGSYILSAAPTYYDPIMPGGNDPIQNLIDGVYGAQAAAFNDLLNDVSSLQKGGANPPLNAYDEATADIQYFIPTSPSYVDGDLSILQGTTMGTDIVGQLAGGYQADLQDKIQEAIDSNADNGEGGITDPSVAALASGSGGQGWVSAGAWFNRVARIQTDLMVAAVDGLPQTMAPTLTNGGILNQYKDDASSHGLSTAGGGSVDPDYAAYETGLSVTAFQAWLDYASANAPPASAKGNLSLEQQMNLSAETVGSSASNDCDVLKATNCIFDLIDGLAGSFGVWHSTPTGTGTWENLLGVQFTGANPLGEIAQYGNALLSLAYSCFDYGILFSGFGGILAGATAQVPNAPAIGIVKKLIGALGGLGQGAGSIMIMIGGIFFTLGFLMAYFVPLIPFIQFFFGIITWTASMLEAVIMAPLVALAHMNPEGDGLPGDMARGGYFLLFQIFLRPVLMVFGLLVGILIFYVAVAFLNAMFAIAVAGTGGLSHGHFTAARLFYTVIYVLLVVIAANHSFDLISRLPNMSMQWLGVGGTQGMDVESVAGLEGRLGTVSGIVGNQAAGQLSQAAGGAGQRIGGMLNTGKPTESPQRASGTVTGGQQP